MRDDMKDVIIDVYRRGGYGKRGRSKKNVEDMPEREGMAAGRGWWRREPTDRLNPLVKYLDKQVGRKWDDVYSEICNGADPRNIRGWHIRDHIKDMVISETKLLAMINHKWRNHYWGFYEDNSGILRKYESPRHKWKKPEPNADECVIGNKPYSRVNGCWFEAFYKEVTEEYTTYNWETKKHEVNYRGKRIVACNRQLGKKELKTLGLSNAPGWKWYERNS